MTFVPEFKADGELIVNYTRNKPAGQRQRERDMVQDISRVPKVKRGQVVDLPVRFLARCIHCLCRFQAATPDQNCCSTCFGLKHKHDAKVFVECPRCCRETSDSIRANILRTPEQPRRYIVKLDGNVMFRDDDLGNALGVARRVANEHGKDVAVEDTAIGHHDLVPLMVGPECSSQQEAQARQ